MIDQFLDAHPGDAGGEEHTPKAVAGVGVVVAAAPRGERRVVSAENQLQPGSEKIKRHNRDLPARLPCPPGGEREGYPASSFRYHHSTQEALPLLASATPGFVTEPQLR